MSSFNKDDVIHEHAKGLRGHPRSPPRREGHDQHRITGIIHYGDSRRRPALSPAIARALLAMVIAAKQNPLG